MWKIQLKTLLILQTKLRNFSRPFQNITGVDISLSSQVGYG